MNILFDASRSVKPRSSARFGAGLLAYVPYSGRVAYSSMDEAAYLDLVAARESAAAEANRAERRRRQDERRAAFNAFVEDRYMECEARRLAEEGVAC